MVPSVAAHVNNGRILEEGFPWWKTSHQKEDFVLAFTALAILWCTYVYRNRRNATAGVLPPGPRGLPLVGNLPFLDQQIHIHFTHLAQTYGPIMKLQLGRKLCVVFSSQPMAKEVMRDHDLIFANRDVPAAAATFTYGGLDIAWSPYGPYWRMLRKICIQELMSKTCLDTFYELRRREVRQMIQEMYSGYTMGKQVNNVRETTFLMIINVMTSMIWGGTIDAAGRQSIRVEFLKLLKEAVSLVGKPNVSDLFPLLAPLDLQGVTRKAKRLLPWLDRILDSVIDHRAKMDGEEKGQNKDLLQVLLQLSKDGYVEEETSFTRTNLKAIVVDMVTGGTDNTATTAEWVITELMKNPEIMRRVQKELEDVVGLNNIVEESHLPNLPYLNSVIKETLRLHPPVPLLLPRSPSQSCVVGGYTVPKGAQVLVNVWAIHRDPKAWENPLEFQPERFLTSDMHCDFSGNDFRYLPFGSGRRVCVGIAVVERMLPYVLASLLHSFSWSLPEGTTLDLEEKFGIILAKATPLVAIPTPRLTGPELYT